ncbi:MAG: DUF4358 domain-containing protein [Firmicutes bacterium]|nr:DUF4358 domain-containing protein [Bacillota bacterium]
MKKLSIVLVLTLAVSALVGCSPNVPFDKLVKAINDQVIADLKATGNFDDDAFADGAIPGYLQLDLMQDENTEYVIDIDKSLLAEGYALAAMFNINADQIIVLKAKDKASAKGVQAALEATLEAQEQVWSQYLPNQYEKVKNNIIEQKGLYFLYVTYGAPENIVTAFNNAFK